MYLYRIGYSDYDMDERTVLFHADKFSKIDFENIIIKSTLEVLLNKREKFTDVEEGYQTKAAKLQKREFAQEYPPVIPESGCDNIDDYVEKCTPGFYTSFNTIYDLVIDVLVEKYKFKKVEYEQSIITQGSGTIVDNAQYDENDPLFQKISDEFWKRKNEEKRT